MYLVDTNILSESSPAKGETQLFKALVDWLDAASDSLFLSVVTIAEVEHGAALKELQGASRKAAQLREWLDAVLHLYGSRILPLDTDTARLSGTLSAQARAAGAAPGFADAAIAATAQKHGLIVLTRNVVHFRPMRMKTINPYDGLPPAPGGPGSGHPCGG